MQKSDAIDKIYKKLTNFKESPLYRYRIDNNFFPVIGYGDLDSKIVFIGEAPGKNEASTGKPFCGVSGKILDQLLGHINLERKNVYITNIVKDRPQDNRDPKPEEIRLYSPFLIDELEIICPNIIAPLGRFSTEFIMKYFGLEQKITSISNMRGKIFKVKSKWGEIIILPLYHPAVAVYNRLKLDELKHDFEILKLNM